MLIQPLKQARKILTRGGPEGGNGGAGFSLLGKNFLFLTLHAKSWTGLLQAAAREIAARHPALEAEEIARCLLERENSGSTAMGDGLAIPHAVSEHVKERLVALVKIPEGADFSAADRKPVTLAFIIIGPEEARAYHVFLLARIARFFLSPGLPERLMAAGTREEAIAILNEMDEKTP